MNIINKLTLRHMRLNRRRTLVTIMGIIISVAMITAVSTFTGSFMDLARRDTLARTGDWQVEYSGLTAQQAETLAADENTDLAGTHCDDGYLQLPDPGRATRPYLYRQDYSENGFAILPMELTEGRMPQAPGEVIVLQSFLEDNTQYKVGDTLRLPQGQRKLGVGTPDERSGTQRRRLDTNEEFVPDGRSSELTIVGAFTQFGLNRNAPGYEVYGALQPGQQPLTMQVRAKNVTAEIFTQYEQLAEDAGLDTGTQLSYNNELLRNMGIVNDAATMMTLFMMVGIVIAIIMIGSVSLIYNAFAISLSERSRYLGMLSSVGATKVQKRNSVFFEGAVLGAIAIPLGMVCGIIGIGITFRCISPFLMNIMQVAVPLRVKVSWEAMTMAAAFSALTIFISAYIPARRASRISAIEAIRQTSDIKLKKGSVKTSPLTRKIFGFTADLGLKNLKRNRGRYRATVFSLLISVVLFLMASAFSAYLRSSYDMTMQGVDYDVLAYVADNGRTYIENSKQLFDLVAADPLADTATMEMQLYNVGITLPREKLHEATLERLDEAQRQQAEYSLDVYLLGMDDASYEKYLKEAGLDAKDLAAGAVLVNEVQMRAGYQFDTYAAYDLAAGDTLPVEWFTYGENGQQSDGTQPLTIAATAGEMPMGYPTYIEYPLTTMLVMRQSDLLAWAQPMMEGKEELPMQVQMLFTSDSPGALCDRIEQLQGSLPGNSVYVNNMEEQRQAVQSLTIIIKVFTYGFVTLLALISVANIFNTISTSIALRKREFAMLKSVGMTPKGFNRMMNYESIFYGLKALLYGLPISFAVMYLLYRVMARNFEFGFFIPWGSVLVAVLAVYAVVGVTMLYGGSKIKKQNIIEGLRQENT